MVFQKHLVEVLSRLDDAKCRLLETERERDLLKAEMAICRSQLETLRHDVNSEEERRVRAQFKMEMMEVEIFQLKSVRQELSRRTEEVVGLQKRVRDMEEHQARRLEKNVIIPRSVAESRAKSFSEMQTRLQELEPTACHGAPRNKCLAIEPSPVKNLIETFGRLSEGEKDTLVSEMASCKSPPRKVQQVNNVRIDEMITPNADKPKIKRQDSIIWKLKALIQGYTGTSNTASNITLPSVSTGFVVPEISSLRSILPVDTANHNLRRVTSYTSSIIQSASRVFYSDKPTFKQSKNIRSNSSEMGFGELSQIANDPIEKTEVYKSSQIPYIPFKRDMQLSRRSDNGTKASDLCKPIYEKAKTKCASEIDFEQPMNTPLEKVETYLLQPEQTHADVNTQEITQTQCQVDAFNIEKFPQQTIQSCGITDVGLAEKTLKHLQHTTVDFCKTALKNSSPYLGTMIENDNQAIKEIQDTGTTVDNGVIVSDSSGYVNTEVVHNESSLNYLQYKGTPVDTNESGLGLTSNHKAEWDLFRRY
jgi:hypothetical protein